jgi:hypothetical protein
VVRAVLTAVAVAVRTGPPAALTPSASVQHPRWAFGVGSRVEHWPHDSAQKADVSVPCNEQYVGSAPSEQQKDARPER